MFRRRDYSTAGQIVKPTSRVVSFSQGKKKKNRETFRCLTQER